MLAILATHPIQYQAPVWRLLASRGRVPLEVLYLSAHGVEPTFDPGFGEVFRWDLDLLGGYPHRFPDEVPPRGARGFWATEMPRCFLDLLRSGKYRALLVPGWHVRACWEAVWHAHRLGIPVWMAGDSNDIRKDSLSKRLVKRLLVGGLLRRVDRFLYVGEATRRLFRSYGALESALVRAPHAVDNARFAQQAAAERPRRAALRRAWGIPDDAFCVLFAGKLESQKRPADLLAALRLLKGLDPGRTYHAMFVGAGSQAGTLRGQCKVAFDAKGVTHPSAGEPGLPSASYTGFLNQSEDLRRLRCGRRTRPAERVGILGARGERGARMWAPMRRERCLRVGRGLGDPAGPPSMLPRSRRGGARACHPARGGLSARGAGHGCAHREVRLRCERRGNRAALG